MLKEELKAQGYGYYTHYFTPLYSLIIYSPHFEDFTVLSMATGKSQHDQFLVEGLGQLIRPCLLPPNSKINTRNRCKSQSAKK